MLTIIVPEQETWDEKNEVFKSTKEQVLKLEHSLVSLSKWESKWHKPFLVDDSKTNEEIIDYIKCMTITQNVPDDVYLALTKENFNQINDYIEDSMTATTFSSTNAGGRREIMTSEVIYYYMIALNIPVEFQKWHLNRLMTLIRVCSIKQSPDKKMSASELRARNTALNAARRKKMNTKG